MQIFKKKTGIRFLKKRSFMRLDYTMYRPIYFFKKINGQKLPLRPISCIDLSSINYGVIILNCGKNPDFVEDVVNL